MGKLLDLAAKFKQLTPERISKELLTITKANEETVTNLNTDQLFAGEDAKGKKLPNYSERSVQVFGKRAGPMQLFNEGDFYKGFFVQVEKFPITIFSHDLKTGKIADLLESKGEDPDDIYGLNKENLTDFSKYYVLADFGKWLRDFIHV